MNWPEMFPPCWADPLGRKERRELAEKLSHACHRVFALKGDAPLVREMADLYMDVTERAEVPAS